MKKAVIYIIIFFASCYILGSISSKTTDFIYEAYSSDLIREITSKLDQGERISIESKIARAYLTTLKNQEVIIDGEKTDNHRALEIFDNNKMVYSLERNNGRILIKSNAIGVIKLETIEIVEKTIRFKNIIFNIATIMVGVIIYNIYSRKRTTNMFSLLYNCNQKRYN